MRVLRAMGLVTGAAFAGATVGALLVQWVAWLARAPAGTTTVGVFAVVGAVAMLIALLVTLTEGGR